MFGRITFYPTLAYNVALERLAFRKWYSRIDETVVLGALPFRSLMNQVTSLFFGDSCSDAIIDAAG
jgi:atypical dual specificity phosphatase